MMNEIKLLGKINNKDCFNSPLLGLIKKINVFFNYGVTEFCIPFNFCFCFTGIKIN